MSEEAEFNMLGNDDDMEGIEEDLDSEEYGNEEADEGDEGEDDEQGNDEDGDNDDENDENDDADEDEDETRYMDAQEGRSKSPSPQIRGQNSETQISIRQSIIHKIKTTKNIDMVATCAIPYGSQCHVMSFTEGPRWILTGGEDGFIRKYDFISSIQGKAPLTLAQKHSLVDSVLNSGVITSYWENEQPLTKQQVMSTNPKIKLDDFESGSVTYEPKLNPIYALTAERNGYWCLSGTLSGGISLYSMRYNEGVLQYYFPNSPKKQSAKDSQGHQDAISVLEMNFAQDKFLLGSWDKTIRYWDLNNGKCVGLFAGNTGQISNVKFRPLGLTDINLTFDDDAKTEDNSDMGSLFGDSDSDHEKNNDNDNSKDRKETKAKTPVVDPSNRKLTNKTISNEDVFMNSNIDGTINIWDIRASDQPVLRYGLPEGTPPWCMSATWSNTGDSIYVARRNSTVEEFSLKMPHKQGFKSHIPNVLKTLQFPKLSGPITAISTMPNDNFLLCGSYDNIRLYNLSLYNPENPSVASSGKNKATPFLIVPGHQGGAVSSLIVDETGRFLVSASGNRGWGQANVTDYVLIYEVDFDA